MAEDSGQRPSDEISIEVAARLLELTPQRINQLVGAGYITRHRRGFTTISASVRGYIRFLKDESRKATQAGAAQRAQEARAKEIEQRIAERDRTLIPIEDAALAMDLLVGAVNREFDGQAARITRDMALRRIIEADVHGAKTRIAKALAESAGFARTGREPDQAGGDE